jgi:hypothetical protein
MIHCVQLTLLLLPINSNLVYKFGILTIISLNFYSLLPQIYLNRIGPASLLLSFNRITANRPLFYLTTFKMCALCQKC